MKEQLKLKGWVKVVVTLLVMGVVLYFYDKVMHTEVNINFCIAYWLGLIPFSFISLCLVWEA